MLEVFIGYDPREHLGYKVACASLLKHCSAPVIINPIWASDLRADGFYTRPQSMRDGRIWDEISNAPCATEFSIARFAVPLLVTRGQWVLFCDVDFLFRADIAELLRFADNSKAVQVVQHDHRPSESVKMDNQIQTAYPRKNWSSFMLWNMYHPGNDPRKFRVLLNTLPGRDLHALCWLADKEIGSLPEEWNWLDGHSDPSIDPKAVHFTRGTPDMPGYEFTRYAPEWNRYASLLSKGR